LSNSLHITLKISALEDISIFSEDEDIILSEVFKNIYLKENGGPCKSHKSSSEELKKYFSEVLPAYDRERVYVSDIKKVLNWYNILQKLELLSIEEENQEEENQDDKTDQDVSQPDSGEAEKTE